VALWVVGLVVGLVVRSVVVPWLWLLLPTVGHHRAVCAVHFLRAFASLLWPQMRCTER